MLKFLKNLFVPTKEEKVRFSEPIFHLSLVGMNTLKKGNVIANLLKWIGLSGYFPFCILCLAGLLENFNLQGFSQRMDFIMPQFQIFGRTLFFLLSGKNLEKLIRLTRDFAPLSEIEDANRNYIYSPHKWLRIIFRTYRIMLIVNGTFYIWSPYVLNGKAGFTMYRESDNGDAPFRSLQIFFILTFTIFALNVYIAYDGVLFYLLAHIIGEIRTVRKIFEKINKLDDYRQAIDEMQKLIVDRHVRIMSCIKFMRKMYANYFLVQFMATLISVCIGLYLIAIDTSSNTDTLIRNVIYIVSFLIPMWGNCYLGDLLCHECLISDEIFYKDWGQKRAYRNKWVTILAIQRAQNAEVLTIGRFAALDLRSFTQLIKTISSFYAMVDGIQHKSGQKDLLMH